MLLEKIVDIFYFFRRFFKVKQEVGAYANISQINYSLKTQQLLCFYLFCTSHFLLKDPPHTHITCPQNLPNNVQQNLLYLLERLLSVVF